MSVDAISSCQNGPSFQQNPVQPPVEESFTSQQADADKGGGVVGEAGISLDPAQNKLDSGLHSGSKTDPMEARIGAAEAAGEAEADAEALALKEHYVKGAAIAPIAGGLAAAGAHHMAAEVTYGLDELLKAHKDGDLSIDLAHKEHYLSDTDFNNVFGMNREQFYAQPMWKQQAVKKQHKLF